jgi:hypothetical protein
MNSVKRNGGLELIALGQSMVPAGNLFPRGKHFPRKKLCSLEVYVRTLSSRRSTRSKRVNKLGKKKWWIGVNCTWSVNGACWESVSKRQTFSTKQTLHFGSLRTLSSRRSTSLPGFNYMQRVAYTAVQEDNLLFSERNK